MRESVKLPNEKMGGRDINIFAKTNKTNSSHEFKPARMSEIRSERDDSISSVRFRSQIIKVEIVFGEKFQAKLNFVIFSTETRPPFLKRKRFPFI